MQTLLADRSEERELDEEQEKQLKRQVQVAARELALYHAGTDGAARNRDVAQTREWLVARWPECPRRAC